MSTTDVSSRALVSWNLRDAGDPVETAFHYYKEGADEIAFLDISATHTQRNTVLEMVERVAEKIFIPLTVGGGVRTVEDIRNLHISGGRQDRHQFCGNTRS